MAIAGKVAITLSTENGGAWSADVTYDRLVAVKHNNNLYISRKTVANVEPPNNEFWFLALEGFSGEDIEKIISGETVVGNSNLLEGFTAEEVGASGARNLIPYPYREISHTEDGVTWTDNGDGTITANGTATDDSIFYFTIDTTKFELLPKEHSLSGGVELCKLHLAKISKTDSARTYIGSGNRTFTAEEGYYYEVSARVLKGDTVNDLTIKPMLELGSVAHDFVPYHFGGAEDAKTLDGHGAEDFAKRTDLANYLPITSPSAKTLSVQADTVLKLKSAESGDYTWLQFSKGGTTLGYFGYGKSKEPLVSVDGNPTVLLHTGNKPTGTYTGNGSATERIIETGSIGQVFMIRPKGSSKFAIVTASGYIAKNDSVIETGTSVVESYGKIIISTTSDVFNASGTTYDYVAL